jgi:hypothetical protein
LRAAQDQLDGVGQLVDARRDQAWLGLGHDRLQLGDGGAGLQRNGHRADHAQRHVDGGVVDAGEAQHADPVAGRQRVVGEGARQRTRPVAELSVGDGLVAGEQLQRGAPGLGVFDELDDALTQCGSLRVAVQRDLDDLGQSQPGLFKGRGDRRVGPGGGELRVVGG